MITVHVHREMQIRVQRFIASARNFVGGGDGFGVPIRPKDGVLENGERKRVRQTFRNDFTTFAPVQRGRLDYVVFGICPVQLVVGVVQSESVWPENRFGYHTFSIRTIHFGPFDLRIRSPVRPEDQRFARMDSDRSGFVQFAGHDNNAMGAVQIGHFHPFGAGIGPKEQVVHPVYGDPAWGF